MVWKIKWSDLDGKKIECISDHNNKDIQGGREFGALPWLGYLSFVDKFTDFFVVVFLLKAASGGELITY